MKIPITIEILKKGKWYIARTPELDFVSQGYTPEEAKKNLLEVIEIQFEEMKDMGTLKDYLEECGYGDVEDSIELISIEKREISKSVA